MTASEGTVTNPSGDNYEVSGIDTANSVIIEVTSAAGCEDNVIVNPPSCNCPNIDPPVAGPNQSICSGETIPALTVTVNASETADPRCLYP